MKTTAIIVAGGKGKRMGNPTPKQFLPLLGKPILYYTIMNIAGCELVDEIILVVPEDYLNTSILKSCVPENTTIPIKFRKGGAERQESVLNGLRALDEGSKIVLIHDGVRPFVKKSLIEACQKELEACDGVIPALPLKDTLKEVSNSYIVKTLDRNKIIRAQTPQVFRRDAILHAYNYAIENSILGTDDAFLVEKAGGKVKIVKGDELNIKITTPFDITLAEWILERGFFDGKS